MHSGQSVDRFIEHSGIVWCDMVVFSSIFFFIRALPLAPMLSHSRSFRAKYRIAVGRSICNGTGMKMQSAYCAPIPAKFHVTR